MKYYLLALVALGCLLAPVQLQAQRTPIAIGAGAGLTQSSTTNGPALHLQLTRSILRSDSLPLLPDSIPIWTGGPFPTFYRLILDVHAELLYQYGSTSGSPYSCEQVAQIYCTGRKDVQHVLGLGTYLRLPLASAPRSFRAYLIPIGVGAYLRAVEETEWQAPTLICLNSEKAELMGCPDNPPFAELSRQRMPLGIGLNSGVGAEVRLGGKEIFVEARLHSVWERDGGRSGALPISVGTRF